MPPLNLGVSLNRTSVGLKRAMRGMKACSSKWPQSNQRGIETDVVGYRIRYFAEPQSNQRGIETGGRLRGAEAYGGRLNRTSVGLKRPRE